MNNVERMFETVISRVLFLFFVVCILGMFALELAAITHLENLGFAFFRSSHATMWAGSILWGALTIFFYIEILKQPENKGANAFFALLLSFFTGFSIAGIYVGKLTNFAHWMNVVIWGAFFASAVTTIVQCWKQPFVKTGEGQASK